MQEGHGRIVIIGFGNMGKALARGLQRSGVGDGRLFVCARRDPQPSDELPVGFDMGAVTLFTYASIPELGDEQKLGDDDTLILCTEPQGFPEVCERWRPVFLAGNRGRPLVVSILAGTTTAMIHRRFAGDCPVVRAMPNIAATVDESATALCASASTDGSYLERARSIFDSVGRSWVVREDQLNTVTGLSGSGPAYIYMVIEALSDGGVKMGMPRQLALELAAQAVLGAARLVLETNQHPAVLRDQVLTPGGTTIYAIDELEKHGLRSMLISAVVTATQRSADLADLARAEEGDGSTGG